jgi:hypothetical protein
MLDRFFAPSFPGITHYFPAVGVKLHMLCLFVVSLENQFQRQLHLAR